MRSRCFKVVSSRSTSSSVLLHATTPTAATGILRCLLAHSNTLCLTATTVGAIEHPLSQPGDEPFPHLSLGLLERLQPVWVETYILRLQRSRARGPAWSTPNCRRACPPAMRQTNAQEDSGARIRVGFAAEAAEASNLQIALSTLSIVSTAGYIHPGSLEKRARVRKSEGGYSRLF